MAKILKNTNVKLGEGTVDKSAFKINNSFREVIFDGFQQENLIVTNNNPNDFAFLIFETANEENAASVRGQTLYVPDAGLRYIPYNYGSSLAYIRIRTEENGINIFSNSQTNAGIRRIIGIFKKT